jgi:transcriptional regulator with XRE-family HTH domain
MLRKLFSVHIRKLRKAKKLSQEKFAEKVGVSTTTVQRWERAEDAPEFDRLALIAQALDCPVKDLFDF